MYRAVAAAMMVPVLAISASIAAAEGPSSPDLELVARARAALGEVRAFEHLNDEIVKRCHEPVTGAYGDWREEFRADLARAHALDKALQRRAADATREPRPDERLTAFTEVEGQALYSRCLRWSTLLIQRESPLRADIAVRFGFLTENETRLRTILGNDAEWQEWRTAGALP
jgi:hypothetical protein